MADKALPAWLEDWIRKHEWPVGHLEDDPPMAIDSADLRALLDGKVLCEKEPDAWKVFDGEGNDDVYLAENNEWIPAAAAETNAKLPGWYTPLYAEATTGDGK